MKKRLLLCLTGIVCLAIATSCSPPTENETMTEGDVPLKRTVPEEIQRSKSAERPKAIFTKPNMSPDDKAKMDEVDIETLDAMRKEQSDAKIALEKSKGGEAAKKKFVDVSLKLAEATMTSPAITSPKEKYPPALRLYRDVVKVDPNNKEANDWIKQIEAIYTSMKMPIPK